MIKVGDKVKRVNYGMLCYSDKSSLKKVPDNIIPLENLMFTPNPDFYYYDLRPDLIGEVGTVQVINKYKKSHHARGKINYDIHFPSSKGLFDEFSIQAI